MYLSGDRRFGGRVLALAVMFGTSLVLTASCSGNEAQSTGAATSSTEPLPATTEALPTPTEALPAPAEPSSNIVVAQATTPVTFSAAQADEGKLRFERSCVECHGNDLRGGLLGGPPLRGVMFEQKYANGLPASGLFLFMSNLMPPDQPGRYTPDAYAELMAYILQRNGFREGAPLPSSVDALNNLTMEK